MYLLKYTLGTNLEIHEFEYLACVLLLFYICIVICYIYLPYVNIFISFEGLCGCYCNTERGIQRRP